MNEAIDDANEGNLSKIEIDTPLQDTEEKIISLDKKIKLYKTRRLQIILISVLIAIVVFIILIAPNLVSYRFGSYSFMTTVIFFVIISLGLSVAFFSVIIFQSIITSVEASIEEFKARKKIANLLNDGQSFHVYGGNVYFTDPSQNSANNSSSSSSSSSSYFNKLVEINVGNLAAYYEQVKAQTNKSFTASLAVGITGFILIGIGLILGFANTANSQILTYISSGSGIVTEFMAAVFFYLYNRTVRQMKGYHDSLLNVQNILLSLKLVEDTKEEAEKAKMVGKMLEYLVGKQVFTYQAKEAKKE